ncbi:MAG: GYF domain-containing protein, partial [Dehalococcoidia bacterium]|nr:GYF domain-containing protein [Dehalococcoidia bacterium]
MSQAKALDFRQVVERANHSQRTSSVILGFLTWGAIVATTWLSLFALDNLLNLPSSLRFPFSIIGLVITVGCFFKYVVGTLRERSSDELVALKLEEQFGIEDNVLINTMQFEDMGYSDDQKAFINATADAATTGWNHVPLRELLQVGRLAKWSTAVVVLLVMWVAYSVLAPDYLKSAFNRYTFSFADAPPEVPSMLVMTPSEDLTIAEYSDLDITLDISKFAKGKELVIYPSIKYKEGVSVFDSQSAEGAEVKMRPVVGNPNFYQYTFETVRRSFSFRIFVGKTSKSKRINTISMYIVIGGDGKEYGPKASVEVRDWIAEGRLNAQSQIKEQGDDEWKVLGSLQEFAADFSGTYTRSVQVTVNPAVKIVESTFTVTPPAYVALPARTQSGPPNPVKCLPETELGVRIKVDKAIESLRWEWPTGTIVFQDEGDRPPAELNLSDAQKAKWTAANDKMRTDLRVIFSSGVPREQMGAKIAEIRAALQDELKKFLSTEQLAKYEQIRSQPSSKGMVWNATVGVGDSGGNYDLIAVVKNMPDDIILSSGSVLLMTDRKPEV